MNQYWTHKGREICIYVSCTAIIKRLEDILSKIERACKYNDSAKKLRRDIWALLSETKNIICDIKI
mgnify:CR=1 FL=1